MIEITCKHCGARYTSKEEEAPTALKCVCDCTNFACAEC